MKFSILTASYNYARFLGDGATSILQDQEGVELEWIVSDGASTDGTQDLAAGWTDPRVTFASEPDRGQSDALNKSLAQATGDIVGWLNADEFYLPGALAAVEEVFRTQPVDMVFGDVILTNADAASVGLWLTCPINDQVLELCGCVIASCAFFVRKEALEGWKFDTDLRILMDWDLYLHLRRTAGAWAHLNRPLTGFRMHEDQVTFGPRDRFTSEHDTLAARYDMRRTPRSVKVGDALCMAQRLVTGAERRKRKASVHDGVDVWSVAHEPGALPFADAYGRSYGKVTVTGRKKRR